MVRIGIDTGGTFTDFVVVEAGRITTWKEPSTPDDPSRAILQGLRRAASSLAGTEIIHGSTVATNALLEAKTARVAFVTNRGFEDLLEIGRQARPDLYDLRVERPAPLAPRDLRFGIGGRILHDGTQAESLTPEEIDALGARLRRLGVEAVALCLLHSYADPSHEEAVAAALEGCGLSVSVSSRLVSEHREYERASTCAVNAAVAPVVSRYLARLEAGLREGGPKSLRVMGSNGGALSPRAAGQEAVRTVLSGPAAGVRAALHVGREVGRTDLISFDMGGTSTDVCLIPGEARTTGESVVAGYPVRTRTMDIHTVGAGGGSIGWRDAGGALRVGPASAGAEPGPACYGRGGPPTVTDANVILGRIVPERFLDDRLRLDADASRRAVGDLARSLGLELLRTAEGIVQVAEATMARAIRVISLHRGHEPGDFVLMAFGGAGGLHAAALAEALGMRRVIIPAGPGVFSAFGMTVADVLKDRAATLPAGARSLEPSLLEGKFSDLEKACGRDLAAEGVEPDRIGFQRTLDVRYRGQSYEINVPHEAAWLESFHAAHRRLYGYDRREAPVEVVVLRVRGVGRVDPPAGGGMRPDAGPGGLAGAPHPQRAVIQDGSPIMARVHERAGLRPLDRITGPALVLESGATTLLPPGWTGAHDDLGHLHLERMQGAPA
ncbi:MAG TPA: hydantoinase/oxoprolinase family protein [Candidatus Polarisedimenticolia bacterium]|jgi:N-methylhydantoinase A